jgi:S-adenosylmethionine hydrolase
VKIITLLTDFGLKDAYVGIMKGVIFSIDPDVRIVDISHGVAAQDIGEAAFMVAEYYPWFEGGAIHVAVVDPTVGGARRPIIVVRENHLFVGPDNGIFSLVMDEAAKVYTIDNQAFMPRRISATFHGRDVFAPAAAGLSSGAHPSPFGPRVDDPVRLPDLFSEVGEGGIKGKVVRFDRFGNAITNISLTHLEPFLKNPLRIEIGAMSFDTIHESYYENEMTCLIGSSGYLEFGYFKGSFKEASGASKGDEVRVRLR